MASWMDPRLVASLRETAEAGVRTDSSVLVRGSDLLQLLVERDSLRAALIRQEYDVVEALAEAQGMTKDPEYGYPTGDHTAETMAAEMIGYCARLREVAANALRAPL
jgi:hypothetical protein